MVDYPDETGKMRDWKKVSPLPKARETLATLSKEYLVYIATGAANSNDADIEAAFHRVGLDKYIKGYVEAEWLKLAESRSADLESGKVESISWKEIEMDLS